MQNYVIAGGRNANPGSLFMSMEPVKLADGMGIAIKSIAYGEVYNVSEVNDKLKLRVQSIEDDINTTNVPEFVSIAIQHGRYERKEHILAALKNKIDDFIESLRLDSFTEYVGNSAEYEVKLKLPPYLKVVIDDSETPLDLMEAFIIDGSIVVSPGIMPEWTEMCFMYLNIVRSSYINGRKSRLLSVFPIHARSGYSYYEFTNPTYVPIEVQEFSEITITLRNIKGKILHISQKFDTVVSLHVKPLKV